MARSRARRTARIIVLGACTLAVAGLFGAVVRQSWLTNSATAAIVDLEADGAEILHPMTTLLGELVRAQSVAVRGEHVDTDTLRRALASVAELDEKHGVALRTSQRLADLTSQVESAFASAESGRAAYDTYSGLVTLTLELHRQIGDMSHLIHDPDLDSYYIMDAAIIRLPDAIVFAGRAADLVALAGANALDGEDKISAAVARFGVSAAAEDVNAGLTTSVDSTSRSELGTNIAERLDAFKAAADAFAPPTMLAELSSTVDAATLSANASRVYAAANPLAHRLLSELQALLQERAAKLERERLFTAGAGGLVVVIGLGMLWLLAGPRPGTSPFDATAEPPARRVRADDLPVGSLTDARQLFEAEEVVHVGRAVRERSRGSGDAR